MPRHTGQGFRQTLVSADKSQLPMYLTYPFQKGITVTDSQGLSPYSVAARTRLQLADI